LVIAIAGAALQTGAAVAHLALAQPSSTPQARAPLSFDGAELGMTVGEWKALPPPPGVEPTAAPDCGPAILAALRDERIPVAAPAAGHTICAYDARFGKDVLLHSGILDGRYQVEGLRYRFADGRLAEIDYTASIDAYNDIEAKLSRKYGRPVATVRDVLNTPAGHFPRVRQTWRTAGGVISLTDPTNDPLRLGVRIASVAAAH